MGEYTNSAGGEYHTEGIHQPRRAREKEGATRSG
jgi:hypothetical protein